MSAKHTPTPWAVDAETRMLSGGHMAISIVGNKGWSEVALLQFHASDNEAQDWAATDAAFIVRAANAHDDLLAALLAVSPWKLQDCWCLDDDHGGGKNHGPPCLLARAAIAKARGGA